MTAKIKLNSASGGGSFSLQAPSSSSNNRVMTLPDTADGTILTTTNPKAGNILQVKQTLKQDVFSKSSSQTYSAITGLSVSITPSSASNKILIFGTIYNSQTQDDYANVFALFKDGSHLTAASGTGSGNRYGAAMKLRQDGAGNAKHLHHEYLDTAGGTSAITYQYYMAAEGQGYVGRTGDDGNSWYQARCPSMITVMEVAV